MRLSTKTWGRGILWAWIALLLMPAIGETLGRVEGRYWPVVRDTAILRVDEDPRGVVFEGTAKKTRSCHFREIRWFLARVNDTGIRIGLTILEREKLRPVAPFAFGPWSVRISTDELLSSSYAEVLHDCHPLFPTVTRFWTGALLR